jgi:hypothetical protein
MNDRCAAGCGRYLGYIADEMNMGLHELGPMAMKSKRRVAHQLDLHGVRRRRAARPPGAGREARGHLAGLHRAIILRAMSILARSGGVDDEFTFTGGVAKNEAAVNALRELVKENYGERDDQHQPRLDLHRRAGRGTCSPVAPCRPKAAPPKECNGMPITTCGHRRRLRARSRSSCSQPRATAGAELAGQRCERIRRRDPMTCWPRGP